VAGVGAAAGDEVAAAAAGASAAAGMSMLGPGVGAGGVLGRSSWRAAGRGPGAGRADPELPDARAGAEAPLPPAGNASFNLRTTGGSIVEDADRTNSPSSWSLAITTLLSTPNSLASS
jgi:hypothetical protein